MAPENFLNWPGKILLIAGDPCRKQYYMVNYRLSHVCLLQQMSHAGLEPHRNLANSIVSF